MTSDPHQAGTPFDLASAQFVKNSFDSYGLDGSQLFDYNVLLDYPNENEFNKLLSS